MGRLLLTAVDCSSHVHLIIGSNAVAGARCTRSLEVGAKPTLITPANSELHFSVKKYVVNGDVDWIKREFREDDLSLFGRTEVDGFVDAVFVTLSVRDPLSSHISALCSRKRIPVHVTDAPHLSTFTPLSTYSDGPLQIGITTSGRGLGLASRLCRDIASYLPPNMGAAINRLGTLRRRLWEEDFGDPKNQCETVEDDRGHDANFNSPYNTENIDHVKHRRMRWLSQICEYWPLQRLVAISDTDIQKLFKAYGRPGCEFVGGHMSISKEHEQKGKIILAGAGPGHPTLLTIATYHALQIASVVLADKLVPSTILSLIPSRTPVHIARKFPGNAEAAQDELLAVGLAGVRAGLTVVRLKQGDPFLFGRGGEEVAFFRRHGFEPSVIPGVPSALAAPTVAGIPPTHRGVANQVMLCTGMGRKGVAPEPPTFAPGRTAVFLMALHRLAALVGELTGEGRWPTETPCAVVERASCPDQRVIRTTLQYVSAAVEELGSRPPGLLVVGGCCNVLERSEEEWVVEEGFKGFDWIHSGLDRLELVNDNL